MDSFSRGGIRRRVRVALFICPRGKGTRAPNGVAADYIKYLPETRRRPLEPHPSGSMPIEELAVVGVVDRHDVRPTLGVAADAPDNLTVQQMLDLFVGSSSNLDLTLPFVSALVGCRLSAELPWVLHKKGSGCVVTQPLIHLCSLRVAPHTAWHSRTPRPVMARDVGALLGDVSAEICTVPAPAPTGPHCPLAGPHTLLVPE